MKRTTKAEAMEIMKANFFIRSMVQDMVYGDWARFICRCGRLYRERRLVGREMGILCRDCAGAEAYEESRLTAQERVCMDVARETGETG